MKIKIIIVSLILFFGLHHQKIYAQEKSVFIDTISPYQNIVVGQTIPINVGVTSVTPNTTYKYFFYGGIAPDDYISVQTIGTDNSIINISNITLNGGNSISLSEGSTTPVVFGATVTDNNGCSDISSVVSSLYRSGVGYSACDTSGKSNSNNCYAALSCSIGSNTCDGSTDASASYTCTAYLKYYADPTDTGTIYSGQTWVNTFKASDESLNDTQTIGTGVVLNSLLAMDIGSSLAYGNLSAGQTLSPMTAQTIVTATGNVGLDQTLEGIDMSDGASHTISVGNQRYSLAFNSAYSSGSALTALPIESELNCKKTTSDIGETKPTYWGISIPSGTVAGTYTGTNTIIAVKGETAQW